MSVLNLIDVYSSSLLSPFFSVSLFLSAGLYFHGEEICMGYLTVQYTCSLLCCVWLQCVANSAFCDNIKQCVDGFDEHRCDLHTFNFWRNLEKLPVLVDFTRKGEVERRSLQLDGDSTDTVCPETHFWCPDRDICLPVFVRCNGVYDCPGHEDEDSCDMYECPGYYCCRSSRICVHVTHVCDDWSLCPQTDDELLCDQQCPQNCTCHGLAFFYSHEFAAHQFSDLRYLDVRGSGMNVHQLVDNHILIHLSLASCGVRAVTNFTFQNLHSLDLSDNLLTEVSGHHFDTMPQLTVLFLAGNPLTSVFPTGSSTTINRLDLSRVKMHSVDSSLFLAFPSLHFLNLSHCGVELLQWNSSQMSVVSLRELDLQGSAIETFSPNVLRGFLHLQLLFTDNFKLCCPAVLPLGFDLNYCHTTPDDVSSCDNILGSVTYRAPVAVLATMALLGNVVSLTVRVFAGSTWRLSSSGIVLTHLCVADLGSGLYLATLGLADHLLAGHYVWQDDTWRRGAVCHLAGVLALSCRHAATSFITILSLDRCLHRCQALKPRFTLLKVKVVCAGIWTFSLLLVTVPLSSQWRLFGQQALCVPIPHDRIDSLESRYMFGVMVLAPFVMYVLCCVWELVGGVCSRVAKSSVTAKDYHSMDFQFVVLGSLASGFLYTTACLVPPNSHTGNQKATTHTAVVYFGSTVSCAMNPCLHLYGIMQKRSERIKKERLLKIVNRSRIWHHHNESGIA